MYAWRVKLLQLKSNVHKIAFISCIIGEVNIKIVPKLPLESLLTHHMWGETWHVITLYAGFGFLTPHFIIDFRYNVFYSDRKTFSMS